MKLNLGQPVNVRGCRLPGNLRGRMRENMWGSPGYNLWGSLGYSVWGSLGEILRLSLWDSLLFRSLDGPDSGR